MEQETIYITTATHISIRPKTKGPGKDLEFLSSMLNELNTAQMYEIKSTLHYKVEIIFEVFSTGDGDNMLRKLFMGEGLRGNKQKL